MGQELFPRHEPLEPVLLCPGRIEHQNGRGRLYAKPSRDALKGLFLTDMHPHRNEASVNQVSDRGMRQHLGIQPSTAASKGGGGEVDQQLFTSLLRPSKRGLEVGIPFSASHTSSCKRRD